MFCQARQYIKEDIDDVIICESLVFLESIQAADGSFPEGYAVRHREMIVSNLSSFLHAATAIYKKSMRRHKGIIVWQNRH